MPPPVLKYLNEYKWVQFTMSSFLRKAHKVFKTSSSIIRDILIDQETMKTFDEIRDKLTKSIESKLKENTVTLSYFVNSIKDFSASAISALVS